MKFKNPSNNYEVQPLGALSWFWCLCFGPFFFAAKMMWGLAILSLVLAVLTAGISHLVLPFFLKKLVRKYYLRKGWIEIGVEEA